MTVLEIAGVGRVEVGDDFKSLTPEQQAAEVDAIAATVLGTSDQPARNVQTAQTARPRQIEGQGADTVLAGNVPQLPGDGAGLLRSFLGQGFAAGFGDEIEAGVRSVLPGGKSYTEELDLVREEIKKFEAENPGTAIGAEVAGALTTMLLTGGASAGSTLGQRILREALIGAGFGSASGFGRGEGSEDRLGRAATGGAIGGASGAAGPAILAGGKAAVQAPIRAIRAARDPDAEAGRRVTDAIVRDQELARTTGAPSGLGDQEFRAAQAADLPVTNIDKGGETTRALARSAANISPEGRATLNRTINDRFEGQGERISTFLDRLSTPGGKVSVGGSDFRIGGGVMDRLRSASRRQNRGRYERAFGEGDKSITSPEIKRLTAAPAFVDAMKRAIKGGRDRAVADGFGSFNPRVRVSEDGRILFPRGPDGQLVFPNLQFWDAVKQELDDVASAAFRRGEGQLGGRVNALARQLRDELDRIVPSYREARAGAAAFFDAEDAFEAGRAFVRGSQRIEDARKALGKMSPAERALFARGFAESLIETVSNTRDRVNVLNRIYGSRAAREKIALALGRNRARQLEALLRVEMIMDLARGAIQGNSTTARQLIEAGLAGGVGTGLATGDFTSPTVIVAGLLSAGARRGIQKIDTRVARRVADMLASDDPQVFARAVQRVAQSRPIMDALRAVGARMVEASGRPAGAQLSGVDLF